MRILCFMGVLTLGLTACADAGTGTLLGQRSAVRLADRASVQGCRSLGRLEVSSGHEKALRWREVAYRRMLHQAAQMGATDIVRTGARAEGAFHGVVTALAYECRSSR